VNRRAQLVLVAAVAVSLAFVPVLAAYLQTGYAGDADAMAARSHPGADAVAALDRGVDAAAPGLAADYAWPERERAVAAYRDAFDETRRGVAHARRGRGVGVVVAYDAAAASAWRTANCPDGRGRAFGPCEAHDGVVVQERAGRTHVVAVALNVTVVAPDGSERLAVVLRRANGYRDV